MSKREEASKLSSENIGRRKGSGHWRRHYMSVRYVAFGAAGRAFNGCRDGQFDECSIVVGEMLAFTAAAYFALTVPG